MAIDPVCGMEVDPARASRTAVHAGVTYSFCAPGCKRLFEADPARYLVPGYRPSMGPRVDGGEGAHDAGCGCASCAPAPAATGGRRRLSAVRVRARGEEFRIVQLAGMLLVCSRANGSCCCGWPEKGRMPFENRLWSDEWERRRIGHRLHLSFVGCLGPCASGNNALLQIHGRSIWLKDLNDPALAPAVWDWAEAMLAAGRVTPPPGRLADHVFERFRPPPEAAVAPLVAGAADGDGLEGLDPVCLMEADPATAEHVVEHEGRRIGFCSAGCRERFLAEPAAYLAR
jgi:YHS domain-containing protein